MFRRVPSARPKVTVHNVESMVRLLTPKRLAHWHTTEDFLMY